MENKVESLQNLISEVLIKSKEDQNLINELKSKAEEMVLGGTILVLYSNVPKRRSLLDLAGFSRIW